MSAKRIAFVAVAISAVLLLVGLGPRIIAADWSGAEREANTPPPEDEHDSVLMLSPTSHEPQLLTSIPQEAGMVDQYIEPAAIERVGPSSMLTFTAVSTAYLPLVVNGQGSAASPLPLGDVT